VAEERAKRKLTAILSADVKGYSRLMGEDEEVTVRTITAYREVMTGLIEGQNGRVVDAKGDNLLAEFPSVVDAVRCAVKIQKELKVRNDELPENRRMEFRIGINLGDVIEEEKTIYGDGVNIAARLESLAEGGGICISRTAFDQIKNKLDVGYEYLGEHSVKNIAEPVRVYKVLMEPEYTGKVIGEDRPKPKQWRFAAIASAVVLIVVAGAFAIWNLYFRPPPMEVASVEKMTFPLPDKPSIAVLPFENMSGDPEQEYFNDGITEEIITALSKVPKLFVIARNSTFTYKGKLVKIQQVSEDLGVRYVLEGSVRKAENRVRITAQLIDAQTGHHLWAERYDKELKNIFALQDEITFNVITALQVKLTEGEQARMRAWGTDNFDAYAKLLKGLEYARCFNRESNLLARKMAEEVIALDPGYPRGYSLLGTTHMMDVWLRLTKSPRRSLAEAVRLYQKAIDMHHPSAAGIRGLLGIVYTMMRQHEKGITELEKAIALNPNAADNHARFGFVLHLNGRHKEALVEIEKAIRLNPFPPNYYFLYLGHTYMYEGMYDESIAAYEKALRIEPNNLFTRLRLAAAYSLLGCEEEAHAEAAEVLRINPKFSLKHFSKTIPFKNQSDTDHLINALRKAGLK